MRKENAGEKQLCNHAVSFTNSLSRSQGCEVIQKISAVIESKQHLIKKSLHDKNEDQRIAQEVIKVINFKWIQTK